MEDAHTIIVDEAQSVWIFICYASRAKLADHISQPT